MRPVLCKVASLHEVKNNWTLYDLLDCHEALDIQVEAEDYEYEKAKK